MAKRGVKPGVKRAPYKTEKVETKTINFRVPADKKPYLKPLVAAYIKSLLNPNNKPNDFSKIEDKEKFKDEFREMTSKPKSTPAKQAKPTNSEPTKLELLKQMIAKKEI